MKAARLLTASVIAALCSLTAALAAPAPGPAPEPAKAVDPTRYVGRWYEIARLQNNIEKDCAFATSDWQKKPDGNFAVVQTCHLADVTEPNKVWHASGQILNAGSNTKIRMGFLGGLIHQDYWIVDRADDYSWCIMSTPNSKYLWIMSRAPNMSASVKTALVARARTLGYDTGRLVFAQLPAA